MSGQNNYYEFDTGVNVGGVQISGTTGSITMSGNLTINNSTRSYVANSIPTTGYVQNLAIVFGI
jgi:hypothetical protein